MRDLFAVRCLVELEAARILTTQKFLPKEAESLVRIMEVLCDEDSWDDILKFDFKFHEALIAATGSTRLQKFYRSISAEQRLALTYFRSRQSPSHIPREHRELLNPIRSGAPDSAVAPFRLPIDDSENNK